MEQLPKIVSRRLQTVSPGVHPDANLLVGFAEKSLLASEQAQVLDHLAACAVCREVVTRALPEGALEPAAVANPAGRRTWFHGAVRWAALAACVVVAGAVVISRSQFLQRTPTSVATYKAPAEVDKVEVARNEEQPASSGSPAPAVRARESENKIALSKAAPVASPRRDETPQRQQLADVSPGVSEEKRKPDADQNGLPTYHGAGSRSGGAVDISQAAAAPVSSPVADDAKANKKEFSADKSMKVPVAANEAVQVEAD